MRNYIIQAVAKHANIMQRFFESPTALILRKVKQRGGTLQRGRGLQWPNILICL